MKDKQDLDSGEVWIVVWASILEVGQLQIQHSNSLRYYLGLPLFIYSDMLRFESIFLRPILLLPGVCVCLCMCSVQLRGLEDKAKYLVPK